MKIILIDNSVDTTGASKSLFNAIRSIREGGVEVECIFIHPKGSKRTTVVENAGFKAYELPIIEIRKSIISLLLYFPYLLINAYRVSRIAKKEGAGLIHVNDLYNMTALASKLFRKTKVVTHVRRMPESFPFFLYRIWSSLNIRFADKIIAVSDANKNSLPSNNKTVVIYNPLPDNERYPLYKPSPYLAKKVKILYLANYNIGKGHPYAIEILAKAMEKLVGWQFVLNIYGTDFGLEKNREYRRSLERMAFDRGLSDVVKFNSKVDDIERTMKDHDIVFNLSDSESFSRLTMEALFYGIPTIATDVGGTAEMVLNQHTGILVKRGDIDDMYEGFKSLIINDGLRQELSKNSYIYMRDKFGHSQTVEKLTCIYKSLQ